MASSREAVVPALLDVVLADGKLDALDRARRGVRAWAKWNGSPDLQQHVLFALPGKPT